MIFEGSILEEQGVTFGIVVAKSHVLDNRHRLMSMISRSKQIMGASPWYKRLATLSVAYIYNLRKRRRYRECRMTYTKTRAVWVAIGERRKPEPEGLPGYLRAEIMADAETPRRCLLLEFAPQDKRHIVAMSSEGANHRVAIRTHRAVVSCPNPVDRECQIRVIEHHCGDCN
jgi:hypothetical protein